MDRAAFLTSSDPSRRLLRGWNAGTAGVISLYVLIYVLLEWLSYVRPRWMPEITPWNPQAGLTLAFLLLCGSRFAVVTLVAVLFGEVVLRARLATSPTLLLVASSLWIAVSYAALATILRRLKLDAPIRTTLGAARFAALCAMGTLIVAAGYIALFLAVGEVPPSDVISGIARYWVGDLNGVLSVAPLLVYAAIWRHRAHTRRQQRWEILLQAAALVATLAIVFGLPATDQLRFFYLLFVPVIWIALRWSLPGAILAVLGIQIALIIAARTHIQTTRFIDLEFLMLTLSLTALMLGAAVAERADVLRRVAMREAEQRALLAMAPDGVLTVDDSGTIRTANPAALHLFGTQASPRGKGQLGALLPGVEIDSPNGRATLDGRRQDGRYFPAEIAWARLDPPASEGFLVTIRDATERQRTEEQLRERDAALARAMRFAVAGELASALAHELNQPITALVSYLQAAQILATQPAPVGDRLQATLIKTTQEAIRASQVLRRLRDFYRGGALKLETLHIPGVCEAVVRAFQDRLRRADTSLVVRVDPSMPAVEGDVTQLEIVLHNLLANAVDAVMQVAVHARRIELQATCADGIVVLQVDDSGPGIAAEVAHRVFEPFVTNKPDGMGLGLAISRSLIRARGGELSCIPHGKLGGASFCVRLPIDVPADTPLI